MGVGRGSGLAGICSGEGSIVWYVLEPTSVLGWIAIPTLIWGGEGSWGVGRNKCVKIVLIYRTPGLGIWCIMYNILFNQDSPARSALDHFVDGAN